MFVHFPAKVKSEEDTYDNVILDTDIIELIVSDDDGLHTCVETGDGRTMLCPWPLSTWLEVLADNCLRKL